MSRILIVDDEPSIGWSLREVLTDEGHEVEIAASVESGLAACSGFSPDAMLLDVRLQARDGISALPEFRALAPGLPIIVMTAFGDLDTAVRAMDAGAFDYLVKPFDLERVSLVTARALAGRLSGPPSRRRIVDAELVGTSAPMQTVFKQIALVAPTDLPVLVTGQTGTGKELAAKAIHAHGPRRSRPLVAVSLASLAPSVVESELFGHVRGAFTSATADRKGLFELADGGTIFLDEIGDASLEVQVKLLRVLESHEIWPVGAPHPRRIDVRVIAATNRDLSAAIVTGSFRSDLYHRLRVFPIEMPPLSDRLEDVPMLVETFLAHEGRGASTLTEEFLDELRRREWPGNVRELKHAVEYAAVMSRGGPLRPEHLPAPTGTARPASSHAPSSDGPDAADRLVASSVQQWLAHVLTEGEAVPTGLRDRLVALVETTLVRAAVQHTDGNRTAAAKLLGLDRTTLRGKLAEGDSSQGS